MVQAKQAATRVFELNYRVRLPFDIGLFSIRSILIPLKLKHAVRHASHSPDPGLLPHHHHLCITEPCSPGISGMVCVCVTGLMCLCVRQYEAYAHCFCAFRIVFAS